MHIASYDINTDEWKYGTIETSKPFGFELALEYLCEHNEENRDDELPLGPIRTCVTSNYFVLVAAYSSGREWYEVCIVFSNEKFSESDLIDILSLNLGVKEGNED